MVSFAQRWAECSTAGKSGYKVKSSEGTAQGSPHTRLVSVVVPTRDRQQLLPEALASIRALEGPDLALEILVCDNGKDQAATASIAERFGARHLPVAENGAGAARNAGLLAATGEYTAFLDDDDVWLPGHIRPQLAIMEARPELDAAVGQVVTTDDLRSPTSEPWPSTLPDDGDVYANFLHDYPQIGATVVRTRVRETIGLFDETLLGDQDWEWHLRLARTHLVGFVAEPAVLFRQRPAGSYDSLMWRRLGYTRKVLYRTLTQSGPRRLSAAESLRFVMRHHGLYYSFFKHSASSHLQLGERSAAWGALLFALACSPVHAARDMLCAPGLWALMATLLLEVRH